MVEDIQRFIGQVDTQSFTKMPAQIQAVISNVVRLNTAITQLMAPLRAFSSAMSELVQGDPGGKLATSFSKLRDMLREVRGEATGLGTILSNAAQQVERAGSATSRTRTRATPVDTGPVVQVSERESQANAVLKVQELARIREVQDAYAVSQRIRAERGIAAAQYEEGFRRKELAETARMAERLDAEANSRRLAQLGQSQAQLASTLAQAAQTRPVDTRGFLNNIRQAGNQPQTAQPFDFLKTQSPYPLARPDIATGNIDFTKITGREGLGGVAPAFTAAGVAKDKFRTNLKGLGGDVEKATLTTGDYFRALRSLQIVFGGFTIGKVVQEFKSVADELYKTGERFQIIEQIFLSATHGDKGEAARQFVVASDAAKKYGTDLLDTAQGYARIAASARGSNIEGEKANKLAEAGTVIQSVFGKNSEQASGVFLAFEQILSKGRVQSEEVVKQLSNALPGAFRLAAEASHKTTQQLTEDLQRGRVDVEKFTSDYARYAIELYGPAALANAAKLKGSYSDLGSAFEKFKQQILLGGAEQGLITFFQTLTKTLENQTVLEAARSLGEVLGVVLTAAVKALTFAIETFAAHWEVFTAAIVGFVATGILISLVTTLGFVYLGLTALSPVLISVTSLLLGIGAAIGIVGIGADVFLKLSTTVGKAAAELKKFQEDINKARETKPPVNTNAPDSTRAFNDALQRVEKEVRTFNQDVENQAQLLDLLAAGVSTLSSEYDSYAKVLERIKALERSNTFESLTPKNAETVKQQIADIFLQAERTKVILEDMLKVQKDLDSRQQQVRTGQSTFATAARSALSGNISPVTFDLQKEYDDIILPVLERVKGELKGITDPAQAKALIDNFDRFAKSTQQTVVNINQAQSAMKSLVSITSEFNLLTQEQNSTALLSTIRVSTDFTKSGADVVKSLRQAAADYVQPKIQAPEIRTIGQDLQHGFDPQGTGNKMGHAFVDVFKTALEDTLAKLKDLKTQLTPTGGAPSAGGAVVNRDSKYKELIAGASARSGVDPELITRIIQHESNFDPNAVGHLPGGAIAPHGGQGLMQLVRSTARGLGVTDSFDPEQNVSGGSRYVRELLDESRGDVTKALTRYRGVGPDKDPKYFQNILGDYTGSGYAEGSRPSSFAATTPFKSVASSNVTAQADKIVDAEKKVQEAKVQTIRVEQQQVQSAQSAGAVTTELNAVAITQSTRLQEVLKANTFSDTAKTEAIDAGNRAIARRAEASGHILSLAERENAADIGAARFLNERVRQSDAFVLNLEGEVVALRLQNAELSLNNDLRAANIDAVRRRQQFVDQGVTTPAATARFNAASAAQRTEQLRAAQTSASLQSQVSARDLRLDIDALRDNTIERAANLEARKAFIELNTSGLVQETELYQRRQREIEQLRQLRIEYVRANGPIQQYIDSIGDFGQRIEAIGVGALDKLGDAIAKFATTGKFDFKSFVNGITEELLKLYFQIAVIKPLLEGLKTDNSSSSNSGGGIGGTLINIAGAFAKAYTGSSGADFGSAGPSDTGGGGAFSTGGWVDRVGGIHHYNAGGLVGNDTIPAMLSPGEEVLTPSQQRARKGGKQGDNYHFSVVINAQDGDSVKRTAPQVFSEIYTKLQRNAKRNGLDTK